MENEEWVKDLRAAKQSFVEKRFQEAEELYTAAAKKHAGNANVQLECAEFLLRRGHAQMAYTIVESVVKSSPESAYGLDLMGRALKKGGKLKEAADRLLRANALSPLNTTRNTELAETYVLLAEDQIQIALKNENENSNLMLAKARYQMLRRDYAALVTYLDAKRSYLSEAGRKEADVLVAIAKKLGGIK
jgi:predicted Zn-dependent protease